MENAPKRYSVTQAQIDDPEIGAYDTFGIVYLTAGQTLHIRDISPVAEDVADMAAQFNQFGLSPEHFRDAVEDMLILSQDRT